jgi:hypothetical protein
MRAYAWTFVLACLLLPACHSAFSGTIIFKNDSDTLIWVDQVVGFQKEPPCGYLVAGGSATSNMYRMDLPTQVTLVWYYEADKRPTRTVVDLAPLRAARYRGDLLFAFTPDRNWVVEKGKE